MNTHALILAAGKGTRMKSDLPKALHTVGGLPMVNHMLKNLSNVCERPTLVVGYGADLVKDHVGDVCDYVHQEEQNGTGHAVMVARDALYESDADTVTVLYVDQPLISEQTLRALHQEQQAHNAAMSIATVAVPHFDGEFEAFEAYGRMVRNEEGNVVRIVEKKDTTPEEYEIKELNTGIYCFDREWLVEHLLHLGTDNAQGEYYLTDLVDIAAQQNKPVRAVILESAHEGLGANTIDQVKTLERFA